MKAIVYSQTGGPDVLRLVERSIPAPAIGQVRVRVHISGVNPTDWKSRRGSAPGEATPFAEVVPNQDGAGIVDALGDGVAGPRSRNMQLMYTTAPGPSCLDDSRAPRRPARSHYVSVRDLVRNPSPFTTGIDNLGLLGPALAGARIVTRGLG
jgi:NADPH:quinone reductase-like Zn-dependent oxidoreductase